MRARRRHGTKPYRIRLISGFAEGADQIAIAACPADWTVEAILPFPKDEYLKDFEQSAAGDGRDVRGELLASLARAAVVTELPTPHGAQPGLRPVRQLPAPADRRADRGVGRRGAEARRHRRDRAGSLRRRDSGGVACDRRRPSDRAHRVVQQRQAGPRQRGMERADLAGDARSDPGGAVGGRVRRAVAARAARAVLCARRGRRLRARRASTCSSAGPPDSARCG